MAENEKCSSQTCLVTRHDVNVEWVQCDKCDHLCGTNDHHVLTPLQELLLDNAEYECLKCRGVVGDTSEIYNNTITALLDKEDDFNHRVVESKVICDDMNARYNAIVGEWERRLNDA